MQLFKKEISLLINLNNPHIVRIYDLNIKDDLTYYKWNYWKVKL